MFYTTRLKKTLVNERHRNGPFEKSLVGLYRDDGLGVVKGTDRTRNKIRKQIE